VLGYILSNFKNYFLKKYVITKAVKKGRLKRAKRTLKKMVKIAKKLNKTAKKMKKSGQI